MNKKEVLKSIDSLCNDIDKWITKRVESSIEHDDKMLDEARFEMEGLLVDCNQELSYLRDYIEEKVNDE